MPTITATTYTTEAYVRIDADWTDTPAVTYAGVQRTNTVTGEVVTLRPYVAYDDEGNLLLSCGKGIWWDTELPLNEAVVYCLIASGVETVLNSNTSFEMGTAPWTATGGALASSLTFAHDGIRSGRLTPDGTTAGSAIVGPTIPGILANIPVTVSAWVLTPQGYNAFQIAFSFTYADNTVVPVVSNVEILDDSEWRYITVTATPTKAGSITGLEIHTLGIAPATTLFYVDQFEVRQERPVTVNVCTAPITIVDSSNVRLKDPLNPCNDLTIGLCNPMVTDCGEDIRISYAGEASETRPANTLILNPANHKYAIPVSRRRRAPATELRLITHDCDTRDQVVAINEPGTPLLLQLPDVYCQEDRYISVGDVLESHISIDQREEFRLMALPYITVERPAGPANGVCGTRIKDMCEIYTSWSSMTIAGLLWKDLLTGAASNNSPGDNFAGLRTWDEVNTEFANWTAVNTPGSRTWTDLLNGL